MAEGRQKMEEEKQFLKHISQLKEEPPILGNEKEREEESPKNGTDKEANDFVNISSSSDSMSSDFEKLSIDGSGPDIADFVSKNESPIPVRKENEDKYQCLSPIQEIRPSAPLLEDIVFLPKEDAFPVQQCDRLSENDLFSSWNPAANFVQSSLKRVIESLMPTDIMSASISGTPAKGLKNGIGDNNCFLNVVIQSLWHLNAFRTKFNNNQKHSHPLPIQEDSCPFCALTLIFAQYQFGEEKDVPPTLLRNAMSNLFKSKSRYQLGSFEDAAEAHDAILSSLHFCITGGDENSYSFVHQVFSMHIIEYMKCSCGTIMKPFPCKEFIYYVSAKALRQQASLNMEITDDGRVRKAISFGEIIKEVNHEEERECSNQSCKKKNHLRFAIANLPEVFTIGIVWDTATPTVDYIYEIMEIVDQQIYLKDIFDSVVQCGVYTLRGMISYYGLHYNSYFRNPKSGDWLMFDDSRVTKVGSNWLDVTKRCCSGKWQPFVLWYEYSGISK